MRMCMCLPGNTEERRYRDTQALPPSAWAAGLNRAREDDTLGITLAHLPSLRTLQHLDLVMPRLAAMHPLDTSQLNPLSELPLSHLALVDIPQITDAGGPPAKSRDFC